MHSHSKRKLDRISEALISSGYVSLDEQAKALGLGRSTAWMIVKKIQTWTA